VLNGWFAYLRPAAPSQQVKGTNQSGFPFSPETESQEKPFLIDLTMILFCLSFLWVSGCDGAVCDVSFSKELRPVTKPERPRVCGETSLNYHSADDFSIKKEPQGLNVH
jgi:hypothetical protein